MELPSPLSLLLTLSVSLLRRSGAPFSALFVAHPLCIVAMSKKVPQTDPDVVAALRRRGIKDPGSDPIIAMSRDRRMKELANEDQRLQVSGLVGAVLHKDMELAALQKEIKILEEGVQEYEDQVNLLLEKKNDIQKSMVTDEKWCATFRTLIGPFEAKYEECKAEVKVSFDHAKNKYHESLQKLIDDFGFHPAFKRYELVSMASALEPVVARAIRVESYSTDRSHGPTPRNCPGGLMSSNRDGARVCAPCTSEGRRCVARSCSLVWSSVLLSLRTTHGFVDCGVGWWIGYRVLRALPDVMLHSIFSDTKRARAAELTAIFWHTPVHSRSAPRATTTVHFFQRHTYENRDAHATCSHRM